MSIVETAVREKGYSIHPQSRLAIYRRHLEFAERADRSHGARLVGMLPVLHQARHELEQLYLIVSELTRPPALDNLDGPMHKLLAGHALPQAETHAISRDTQFELYIAAVFRRAGYKVRLDEPDVILQVRGSTVGIAAKRPKTPKKIERRLREARNQIERVGKPGIVAIDVSVVQNPRNGIIVVDHPDELYLPTKASADALLDSNRDMVMSAVAGTHTFGIIVQSSALALVRSQVCMGLSCRWSVGALCSDDDPRSSLLRDIAEAIAKSGF